MGLTISLFVHGTPMGQAIWGAQGDDQRYCASFYGPSWDAPELMKVEAKNLGGSPCCYYTFVKGQNISDCNGRQGAYFALTLRFNACYADFQNIYNILKAACDKLCLGLCLQEAGGQTRFKVADFQSIDKQLKDMGEFVYYGPMQDGNPNGVGVAIYHEDDSVGRLYYYGNFSNGERRDTNAIMFYKDGSYFKGEMQEDQWVKGLFFDVEKEHFIGEFSDNEPYNGNWYKHVKVQTIVNGR